MKHFAFVILLLSSLILGVACREQAIEIPPTEPPQAISPTRVVPTTNPPVSTPLPVPESTDIATSEPDIEPPQAGFCERVDPTLIDLNAQGLQSGWQAYCVPAGEVVAEGPSLGGLPEHLRITFGNPPVADPSPNTPVIYVIPVEAYRALWDAAGNPLVGQQIDLLSDWVARRPAAVRTRDMPVLPVEQARAVNDLAVQGRTLDLENGSGIRFIGRFAQGPMPITNEGLRYMFQGFAGEDNEFLISFFYPVTTRTLPPTSEEVTAEELALLEADPLGYMDERTAALNALAAADWQPDLDLLDALITSLQYGGTETGGEAPPIAPDDGRQPPAYAVVTGAAGVNVRTGPSTAFPSLGIAAPGTRLELIGRSLDGNWWVTPMVTAPDGRGWVSAGFVDANATDALPVMSAPPLPTPMPAPPTPTPPAEPVISFWADRGTINQGECTTLRWSVANIQAVWVYEAGENFERFPATGDGSRSVCPSRTTTYEMRVQLRDGTITTRQVTVAVNPGNTLAGSRWVLARFGDSRPLQPGAPPTLDLNPGNLATGFGGCNPFTAAYSASGTSTIAFSIQSRGFMTCGEEVDEQENFFLSALNRVASFQLSGGDLILFDASGQESMRLLAR